MTATIVGDALNYARALRLLPEGTIIRTSDNVTMRKWTADGWIICQPDGDLPITMPRETFPSEAVFLPATIVKRPISEADASRRTRITAALIRHCLVMAHNRGATCACSRGFHTLQEHIDHQADAVIAELAKEGD